ncbi:hypothetical protein Sjap_014523 [Stephania japonica]|uniref:Uncharacterized protein n=1 Tax=Stephania japonica TaxID=461633 RepID=A0AAP0IIV8_9MAGN
MIGRHVDQLETEQGRNRDRKSVTERTPYCGRCSTSHSSAPSIIVSSAPPSPLSPPSFSAKPSPLSPPSFSALPSHLLCSASIVSAPARFVVRSAIRSSVVRSSQLLLWPSLPSLTSHLLRRDNDLSINTAWNITGIYKGTWGIRDSNNDSSCLLEFEKSNGIAILELASSPTKITEVHYVQGVISFHDAFDNNDSGASQLRVEGVYMRTLKQLRMVVNSITINNFIVISLYFSFASQNPYGIANLIGHGRPGFNYSVLFCSGKDGELTREDDYVLSNPYHLLGIFSSQVFQDSPREKIRRRKKSSSFDIEKRCNLEIAAQISHISSGQYVQLFHLLDKYHSLSGMVNRDLLGAVALL